MFEEKRELSLVPAANGALEQMTFEMEFTLPSENNEFVSTVGISILSMAKDSPGSSGGGSFVVDDVTLNQCLGGIC